MAAVNTGNNLLFLIVATMLGFMAMSGIFGLRNLQRLQLQLLLPDEIYPGVVTMATVQLASRGKLPHFLLTVHLQHAAATVPFLPRGESVRLQLPLTFAARGHGSIERLAVTSPFPVNFFVRSTIADIDCRYLVFPGPLPLPTTTVAEGETAAGDTVHRQQGGSGELEAISPYTGREPLKLVHWKLAARHDELLVKELQAEQGIPVTVDPDELPGGVEERLSRAAFLINSLMAEGRPVGLRLAGESLAPGISRNHRLTMLARLASHAPA